VRGVANYDTEESLLAELVAQFIIMNLCEDYAIEDTEL
jgi:hypothetical protein